MQAQLRNTKLEEESCGKPYILEESCVEKDMWRRWASAGGNHGGFGPVAGKMH